MCTGICIEYWYRQVVVVVVNGSYSAASYSSPDRECITKSINKNQTLSKHIEKKWVLSLRLNELTVSASRTAAGILFHTTGPATEKALSPNFVLVRGTE